jgi:hypothetical protein
MVDVPKFLIYEPDKLKLVAGSSVSLAQITKAMARELHRALDGSTRYVASEQGVGVGQVVGGVTMTNQLHVEHALPQGEEIDWQDRYVLPAAHALASVIKSKGLTTLSDLGIPNTGVGARINSQRAGISLRGAIQHDMELDQDWLRFDVIGGHA